MVYKYFSVKTIFQLLQDVEDATTMICMCMANYSRTEKDATLGFDLANGRPMLACCAID
jgi:hypothetical protein